MRTLPSHSWVLAALFCLVLSLERAQAATLEVGVDKPYTTIQSAIDAAGPGDLILVHSGVYDEQLVIDKNDLKVQEAAEETAVFFPQGKTNAIRVEAGGFGWSQIDINVSGRSEGILVTEAGANASFRELRIYDDPNTNPEAETGWGSIFICFAQTSLFQLDVEINDTTPDSFVSLLSDYREVSIERSSIRMFNPRQAFLHGGQSLASFVINQSEIEILDMNETVAPAPLALFRPFGREGTKVKIQNSRITGSRALDGLGAPHELKVERSVVDLRRSQAWLLDYRSTPQGWRIECHSSAFLGSELESAGLLLAGTSGFVSLNRCTLVARGGAGSSLIALYQRSTVLTASFQENIFYQPGSQYGVIQTVENQSRVDLAAGINLRHYADGEGLIHDYLTGTIIDADPLLAPDRIHLTATSPAIDRVSNWVLTLDIDGEQTPIGGLADLGADEFAYDEENPVSISVPRGGLSVEGGSSIIIPWRTYVPTAGTALRFELHQEGRGFVANLGDAWGEQGFAETPLTLPLLPGGDNYFIRAISIWDPSLYVDSAYRLNVSGRPLRVTSPASGDHWLWYETRLVSWEANVDFVGTEVSILLWAPGPAIVAELARVQTPDGSGSVEVQVPPAADGSSYSIQVVSTANPFYFDQVNGLRITQSFNPPANAAVDQALWLNYE